MKIAFLGASMTEGVYGGNFVTAAAAHLPEHTLINRGVSGNTVNRLYERVESVLADEPDACFILSGGNDTLAYAFPATRPYYKSQQNLPNGYLEPDEYATILRDIVTEFTLHHVLLMIGLAPMEYNATSQAAAAVFNAKNREVADSLNLSVFDFGAHFNTPNLPERPPLTLQTVFQIGDRIKAGWNDYATEQAKGGYTYTFDGIHFTPQAATRAGEVLATWIKQVL